MNKPKMGSDFTIRRYKIELKGTGYYQISPGKYQGLHWQDGSVFVNEDVFGFIEGIICNYYPNYNPMGPNDIPKELGLKIADAWDSASSKLLMSDPKEVLSILNLDGEYGEFMFEEIKLNKILIAKMLGELSTLLRDYYNSTEWICILGI